MSKDVSIQDIKDCLDGLYRFDVLTPGRNREHVYARKVFINLAYKAGFRLVELERFCENKFNHDVFIFHIKNFSCIKDIDIFNFNRAIDDLGLDLEIEKIFHINYFLNREPIMKLFRRISKLSIRELNKLDKNVVSPYLNELETFKKQTNG